MKKGEQTMRSEIPEGAKLEAFGKAQRRMVVSERLRMLTSGRIPKMTVRARPSADI